MEDINGTYELLSEGDIPYLAITDYSMVNESGQTDWNPDPGETVNLTLTIKNVGQAKVRGIKLHGLISPSFTPPFVANFTDTQSQWIMKDIGDLDVGESATVDLNITAISPGLATVGSSLSYQGQPSLLQVNLPLGVSYSGPILVPFADWSDYVVSPGDEVNLLLTFKNFGADAGTTNASIMPLGFITDINMSATFRNLGNARLAMDEVILHLGSLAHSESVTANITMISDPFYYTQTGAKFSSFAILLNASQLLLTVGPLAIPGVRPNSSLFLEVERTPEVIEGNPGDETTITVRLHNLGTTAVEVTVEELVPEGCELVEGETNATVNIGAGEEAVLTFKVRISGASSTSAAWVVKADKVRTPVPLPTVKVYGGMTYKWGYLGLKGTPQGYCSAVWVRLPSGSSLSVALSGEAVVSAEELGANPFSTAPSGAELLGWFLSVAVSNESAFENMTLTVHYNEDAVISAGLDESSLRIYAWDGSRWVELPSKVDTENNTVTATVTHISYFTLGVPGEAPAAGLLPLVLLAQTYYNNLSTRNLYLVGGLVSALAVVAIATILYRRIKR
ncbi:MAG: hypothetical protein ACTSP1_05980 [Candidatus Freyarchaeota archaeon]